MAILYLYKTASPPKKRVPLLNYGAVLYCICLYLVVPIPNYKPNHTLILTPNKTLTLNIPLNKILNISITLYLIILLTLTCAYIVIGTQSSYSVNTGGLFYWKEQHAQQYVIAPSPSMFVLVLYRRFLCFHNFWQHSKWPPF